MGDPFTIRIFVPDGDPDGVRIIDRMNWTGVGLAFPRSEWKAVRMRPEFIGIGVYILSGYREDDADLPTVYVGQADGLKGRIDSHHKSKDFWDSAIVFTSTSGGLNRAHVTWLEYALLNRAKKANRCHLENGNLPQEPALTEAEKADTQAFLKEILQILPLVSLRAFEPAKIIVPPETGLVTIVVPAKKEGFQEVFMDEDSWYSIRISGGMLEKIKYIAAYQTAPISAVTHYAPVDRIEPYGDGGKYRLFFSEKAQPIGPIPLGKAAPGSMQSSRYTTLKKLKGAKELGDLF